jgi:hypothetical protein
VEGGEGDAELAVQQAELHEQDDDGVVDQDLVGRRAVVELAEQAPDVLRVLPSYHLEQPVLDDEVLGVVDNEGVLAVEEAQSLGAGLATGFQNAGVAVAGGAVGAAIVGLEEEEPSWPRKDLVDVEHLVVAARAGRVGALVVFYLRHDVAVALRAAALLVHYSWLLRGSGAGVAHGVLVDGVSGSELAV